MLKLTPANTQHPTIGSSSIPMRLTRQHSLWKLSQRRTWASTSCHNQRFWGFAFSFSKYLFTLLSRYKSGHVCLNHISGLLINTRRKCVPIIHSFQTQMREANKKKGKKERKGKTDRQTRTRKILFQHYIKQPARRCSQHLSGGTEVQGHPPV